MSCEFSLILRPISCRYTTRYGTKIDATMLLFLTVTDGSVGPGPLYLDLPVLAQSLNGCYP